MRWIVLWLFAAGAAVAEGEPAGAFDYYVLSLSWSPTWCALDGDRRGSPQCDTGADFGWVLHGLWPQFENGWPSYCPTAHRNPSRSQIAAMADIMGSGGSAWHQWKKHGRCSGISSEDYYALARDAYTRVTRPEILRSLKNAVRLPASVIEEAFLEANPDLSADGLTITCKSSRIQEARICLTRGLEPRECSGSVARVCSMQDAIFSPIR